MGGWEGRGSGLPILTYGGDCPEAVGLTAPRLALSETRSASGAAEGTSATLTCSAQAQPIPSHR